MIFGTQLLLLGGFIIISTPSYYQNSIGATGFLLMLAGTVVSLIGLLKKENQNAESKHPQTAKLS